MYAYLHVCVFSVCVFCMCIHNWCMYYDILTGVSAWEHDSTVGPFPSLSIILLAKPHNQLVFAYGFYLIVSIGHYIVFCYVS